MDNQPTIHIDQSALIKQMTDKIIVDFMSAMLPDEKTRKFLLGTVTVLRKYGIDATTSMKIMIELADIFKEDNSIGEEKE